MKKGCVNKRTLIKTKVSILMGVELSVSGILTAFSIIPLEVISGLVLALIGVFVVLEELGVI